MRHSGLGGSISHQNDADDLVRTLTAKLKADGLRPGAAMQRRTLLAANRRRPGDRRLYARGEGAAGPRRLR